MAPLACETIFYTETTTTPNYTRKRPERWISFIERPRAHPATKSEQEPSLRHVNIESPVKSMLVFLDFDGVLRRLTSDPSRLDPDCLERFESAIRPFSGVKIVVSSTWRFAMSRRELRSHFSSDVAERIIGITPEAPFNSIHGRYKEICAYLKMRGIENERWVAIDDDPKHYPKNAPVLLTDPSEGLDEDCAIRLGQLIDLTGEI